MLGCRPTCFGERGRERGREVCVCVVCVCVWKREGERGEREREGERGKGREREREREGGRQRERGGVTALHRKWGTCTCTQKRRNYISYHSSKKKKQQRCQERWTLNTWQCMVIIIWNMVKLSTQNFGSFVTVKQIIITWRKCPLTGGVGEVAVEVHNYNQKLAIIKQRGWRRCTRIFTLWTVTNGHKRSQTVTNRNRANGPN